MKLGVMVYMDIDRLENEFVKLKEYGFDTCQLGCWKPELFTPKNALIVKTLMEKHDIEVSAFWCGWSGPCEWNLNFGPVTIGLVPTAYRTKRIEEIKACSDFVKILGVTDIVTHVGFIPNSPADPEYYGFIGALRHLVKYLKNNNQNFLFETGQEAPVALLRTIEDIGYDNLGINLDPANLLMYGLGNPIDALDVFGKYVRNVHAKDGLLPTCGRELGEEVALGEGLVNFPKLIEKLKALGYDRYITIEREISGDEQIRDIMNAKKILTELI